MPKARSASADDSRAALETRALLAARALVDRMRSLYRELEQLTGAPISLHRALVSIGQEPGLPASRLARLLGMRRPAMSQTLKSLAARGWIDRRRDEDDQRLVRVYPTAAGREILQATAGRAVFTLQKAVCSLDTDELGKLASGIERLLGELPELAMARESGGNPPRAPAARSARRTRTARRARPRR
jgi:DNA-binding MarR family transcriptional regulator